MVWVKTLQIDVFMHFDFMSFFFIAKYVQGIKYPLIRLDTKNKDKEVKLRLQKLILQF